MRILAATVLVAACSFEHGVVDEDTAPDAGIGPVAPTGDGGTPTPLACKYPDPELRLCIEFDDRRYTPVVFDASQYGLNATASGVVEVMRDTQPAAATNALTTSIRVPESPMLDIRNAITFEAWVQVPAYQIATLLSNDTQYAITMDANGRVSCRIGNQAAVSDPIGTNVWRHIACTFSDENLSVHVDGAATRCQSANPIPTGGKMGTKVAVGLTGAIDDVRIYARRLTRTEICSHADKTACASACTDD